MTALPTPRVPLNAMTEAMLNQELSNEVHRIVTDPVALDQVLSAALVATHLHAGQTRFAPDGGTRRAYIEHPLRNTLRLIRWGVNNPMVLIASLMHDTVEDQVEKIITDYLPHALPTRTGLVYTADETTGMREQAYAWLGLGFGERVATLVARVTRPLDGFYIDHITEMVEAARGARTAKGDRVLMGIALQVLLTKAADLADNAGSLAGQYGTLTNHDINYWLERYLPAVTVVLDEVYANRAYLPAARAFSELDRVLTDLKKLQTLVSA